MSEFTTACYRRFPKEEVEALLQQCLDEETCISRSDTAQDYVRSMRGYGIYIGSGVVSDTDLPRIGRQNAEDIETLKEALRDW